MTPLVLLVGFLGSGKTTFLRRLLPELKKNGLVPHVIINDYQNASVDAALLREVTDLVRPISGSCVCCDSRDELLNAMAELPSGPSSVLLVETNGTTDAEELLELLTLESRAARYTLPVQVTIVDAKRWQKRFWHNGLERGQARPATHFMISRRDQVPPERYGEVEAGIRQTAPHAVLTAPGDFARELAALSAETDRLSPRVAAAREDHEHGDHGHDHHHVPGDHHFASMEIPLPARVRRAELLAFLQDLPEEALRAKGVAVLEESPNCAHVFQRVGADEEVLLTPLQGRAPCPPVLVLIGAHLPEAELRARAAALA